jgi:nitrilase
MRTVACEGRTFVLSANQCIKTKDLPAWIDKPGQTGAGPTTGHSRNGNFRPRLKSGGRRISIVTRTEDNHEITWPMKENEMNSVIEDSPQPPIMESDTKNDEEYATRGGSCIIGPLGQVLGGPLWDVDEDGLLYAEVDFDDCERGRLDFDAAGSYSRNDSFSLHVGGLDLNPPP